ncbi:hypothetical protein N7532_002760 [Penicillium argentinense]|uniref:Uncharacterized protein n=1 Tax=Penicillium argentinense TaxID=1131581 RepID=A0A9W9KKX8_9EURO|nr:uncharacterized protein N7532_002760 [Penicillium argentinense]KAJ5110115.1 hypothetical protein N7532_002760 [Penicillium argentinense]
MAVVLTPLPNPAINRPIIICATLNDVVCIPGVTGRLHAKDIRDSELLAIHEASVQGVQHELEVSKVNWRSLLQKESPPRNGHPVDAAVGDINAINYYLPVVFASLHVSRQMSLILYACNAINVMIFTTFAITAIDGRKRLMLWGAVWQGTCFALLAAGLAVGGRKCVRFVLDSHSVDVCNRGEYTALNRGAGLATATNWICNYAVVLVTPIGIRKIDWRYYIIYVVLNFHVFLWFPCVFEGQKSSGPEDMLKDGIVNEEYKARPDKGQSEWVESVDSRKMD